MEEPIYTSTRVTPVAETPNERLRRDLNSFRSREERIAKKAKKARKTAKASRRANRRR